LLISDVADQPTLPGLGLTDRHTPLLLESLSRRGGKKGLGDEVDATKKKPEDDSVSLSVSIEEKRLLIDDC
jgi:hypothetical protein